MSTDAPKLSANESIKEESNFLKGTIDVELTEDTDQFNKDNQQLLKFHGTYQQDDRDARMAAKKTGGGKEFSMMVRCRIPGGRITCDQMLAQLDLCDELGNSTLKITTRQTLQLHGVVKGNLRKAIHRINEIQLSTLAACGDVNRNVVCCPAKRDNAVYRDLHKLTDSLVVALAPQTPAYHELWVTDPETGESTLEGGGSGEVVEPLYGPTYLPRKFKIGIALPHDNCIDIYTQDLGFLAVIRDDKVIGYNVLVGGGMGTTPSAKKTFPALAKRMAFCTPEQAVDVAVAVVKVQRDHGNREDRKVARMKYLIADWGIEKFRAKVEEYFGESLQDCTEDDVHEVDDHMGWQEQGDGKWSYGLNIENGRLYDNENHQLKATIRAVCHEFKTELRMTTNQSIIFTDIEEGDKDKLIALIKKHNAQLTEDISMVRRWSIACVALPTCGLAITESERRLPGIIDSIEQPLAKLGLDKERFTLRMTGCPNGCARPYNADLALVGKAKDKYTLFAGGGWVGDRMAYIYKDLVKDADVADELIGIFSAYKSNRLEGESLGTFCTRVGRDDLEVLAAAAPRP
ncbi:NADPH-dependent assimilatory sulfite reductase hemoprotein subunit [Novipirellula sp.]|uniref:NADPH-dependent assimilatory sulfite reductase hemoprotein subunit n=1 Tax=Novipirellula sp. TaxID=2795430 RepID=UPI00356A958B